MKIKSDISIGFQEIPDEISLIITVCGCKRNCPNCHSPENANPDGISFDYELINKYSEQISCVLFMGGENEEELTEILKTIRLDYRLKTALYSGGSYVEVPPSMRKQLDYLKIGSFKQELGGLKSPQTNQELIKFIRV